MTANHLLDAWNDVRFAATALEADATLRARVG
jgi:hypothetical protein